jgi:hypothetical protein
MEITCVEITMRKLLILESISIYYLFIIKPTRCTNFTNLFWHETLHVSDNSSVHRQEFIHCTLSNGIYHTGL